MQQIQKVKLSILTYEEVCSSAEVKLLHHFSGRQIFSWQTSGLTAVFPSLLSCIAAHTTLCSWISHGQTFHNLVQQLSIISYAFTMLRCWCTTFLYCFNLQVEADAPLFLPPPPPLPQLFQRALKLMAMKSLMLIMWGASLGSSSFWNLLSNSSLNHSQFATEVIYAVNISNLSQLNLLFLRGGSRNFQKEGHTLTSTSLLCNIRIAM